MIIIQGFGFLAIFGIASSVNSRKQIVLSLACSLHVAAEGSVAATSVTATSVAATSVAATSVVAEGCLPLLIC